MTNLWLRVPDPAYQNVWYDGADGSISGADAKDSAAAAGSEAHVVL